MRLPRGFHNTRRLASITAIFIKHAFRDLVQRFFTTGKERPKTLGGRQLFFSSGFPSPKRLRLILEELGPSFIKLGQLMSTRADMFPPEYIQEFRKLQDRVPPVPFHDIKTVIEEELGHPLGELFKECDPDSIAAASVAQVHLGRLFSGIPVVIKVVRPGIHKRIQEDVSLMYYLAGRLERSARWAQVMGADNLVAEFERTVSKELNMLAEAGNIDRFARAFKDDEEIYIPKVYLDYTSRSVLVMEHIQGIKLDQVETIKAHGIDPKEVAMIGLRSFSRQLMEFGFFHGDPHPGNTIVMHDGRVAMVDFGITGYLDEELMDQIAAIFLGYAEHDYHMILDALVGAGLVDENGLPADRRMLLRDLKDMSEPFYGRSLRSVSVKDVYDETMRLVVKHNIRLPRNLLLLLKTLIQTEALGKILDSDASILATMKPYAKELLRNKYTSGKALKNFGKEIRAVGNHLKIMPELVHHILKQTAGGKQRLELWHGGFKPFDTHFEKGINRITIGIIISACLIAGAHILTANRKIFVFAVHRPGLETLSLTVLLGLLAFVVALFLGIWLVISILRSGKL
jgi:ubiquinone biosynthesis protein